ncbi:MAG: hypothetical protein KF849_07620 [Rhizobiaceae bacterium]|nr:hypothetical protein [Rhizobiaceae bacterium]
MAIQEEIVVAGPAIADDGRSYVDWPAIFAGTVVASAISFLLVTFGSAVGLSLTSAYEGEGMSLTWFAVAAGLWLLWVQVSSFFAGGYLAGRLRKRHGDASEYESDLRDGAHGLVVWGLGLLLGAAIAFVAAGGAAATATSAVGTAATVAAEAVDPSALLVDRSLRGAPGAEPVDEGTRSAVGRILLSAATEDGLDPADRDYLIAVVAERAGIPAEEAQTRVDQLVAQAQQLEADARAAADRARRIGVMAAFLAAAALLVSGVAAYWGATMGGNHRDKQTVIEGWLGRW